jgi:hypothetical protein
LLSVSPISQVCDFTLWINAGVLCNASYVHLIKPTKPPRSQRAYRRTG